MIQKILAFFRRFGYKLQQLKPRTITSYPLNYSGTTGYLGGYLMQITSADKEHIVICTCSFCTDKNIFLNGHLSSKKIIEYSNIYPIQDFALIQKSKIVPKGLQCAIAQVLFTNYCGIFGECIKYSHYFLQSFPIVETGEKLVLGKAYLCTTLSGRLDYYQIELTKLHALTKTFQFKIVDQRLYSFVNGIIPGMSGSPILQKGKLVGVCYGTKNQNSSIGFARTIDTLLESIL